MYSVVLMMAMTTGTETPDCHRSYSCHGCYGCSGYYGCSGCSGYYGCGGCYGCTGGVIYSAPTGTKPVEGIKTMPKPEEAKVPTPARIVVSLPADATLTFDGMPTKSTSSERVFMSPALVPNRDFHYTLRAQVMRDGKPLSVEQVIEVRAGRESRVVMNLPQGLASR